MDPALKAIQQRFIAGCSSDLAEIRRHLSGFVVEDLGRRIHNLAGLAGSIGFEQLSAVAQELEDVLATGGIVEDGQLRRLETALMSAIGSYHENRM